MRCGATVKVGIPEFLNGIGKGVEAHVEKLETEFGSDLQKLLVARTLKLKKLEIPCKHVSLSLHSLFPHSFFLNSFPALYELQIHLTFEMFDVLIIITSCLLCSKSTFR